MYRVSRSTEGGRSKGCRQKEIGQPMHRVLDQKSCLEILSKAGTRIGCILRASKAQMTYHVHTRTTHSGRHGGRRWPGRDLKTSGTKAACMGRWG